MASPVSVVQCIDRLKLAYPNYQPDIDKTADLWEELFVDVPDDTLHAAVIALLAEPRAFAPSAGEVRGKAQELNARAAGIPDAYQAYEEVCKMPPSMELGTWLTENNENVIEYRKLKFSHPLVETVARLIGWPKTFPTDNSGVDRGQFRQAYDAELLRYMQDAGRHPALTDYIQRKSAELSGKAPQLMADVTKRLTKGD